MPIKFKIQNGLRVNTTDVLNSTGEFIGGRLLPTSTESATSITTGALVVPGGAGVAENLFVGGAINNITFNQPANTSSLTIGSNITLGFPNSLSFPLTKGVDGYVLITDGNGALRWGSVSSAVPIPVASSSTLGGVKIGSGINVTSDGTINVDFSSVTSSPLNIKTNGSVVTTQTASINFTGAGVTTTAIGNDVTVDVSRVVNDINLDGGGPGSVYGGINPIDGGYI